MKSNLKSLWIVLLIILSTPFLANAYEYSFQQAEGIKIEVLSEKEFSALFGNNTDIPRTDKDIIELARKLYPPQGERPLEPAVPEPAAEGCGTYDTGLLFAALKNPAISDATRYEVDAIIAASTPKLDKTYSSGHFMFHYTTTDQNPLNNVTEDAIKETAKYLNLYWDTYSKDFRTPLHNSNSKGEEILTDVEVFYRGDQILGETTNERPVIFLSSSKTVMDNCMRMTTSAHELFHRVQFSYGFDGRTNTAWIGEGTAVWAQKYTNADIRDYMARMNWGLVYSDIALFTKSYGAANFWIYLEEVTKSWSAIRSVWAAYEENNSKDAKAAVDAVNKVVTERLHIGFEEYVQLWIKTNYLKDLKNKPNSKYDYSEDEVRGTTSCGLPYGPLKKVKKKILNVGSATIGGWEDNVPAYGAHYYEFKLDPALKKLEIKIDGDNAGNFSYHFIGIKSNNRKEITDSTSTDYTYKKTLTPGQWDKVALVVGGRNTGGNYKISVVPSGCRYTGTGKGTFSGDDSGTWYFSIDDNCKASGGGYSKEIGNFKATGDVASEGEFAMVAGSADSGAEFSGKIYDTGEVSGTWWDTWGESGTFEGVFSPKQRKVYKENRFIRKKTESRKP